MRRNGLSRLIDVAVAAGVSRSTASNVFSAPDRVRPELRQRVEAAARALGYLGPDPRAKLLRAGKVNAIGVIPPAELGVADTLRNPVFAKFLLGVGEACDSRGASLLIIPDGPGHHGTRSALVDGLIFGRIENLAMVRPAQLRRLPFAVVDFDAGPEIATVKVDSRQGSYEAARHLVELGHRRFAIVSFLRSAGPARVYPPSRQRSPEAAGMFIDQEKLRGYADAFAEAGLDIAEVPIVQANPWDIAAAPIVLDAAPEATAILSMSVMQALAVVKEARRRGIAVPSQLSVVGYNDIAEAAQGEPPLTTIDARGVDKGRLAAEMVFAGGPPRQEILVPRLVIRKSTAPPPRR
ncbi:MAG: LacI family DNA-binding transcriptional regulator [Aestuariivirga sp.]|jgi:DNA-binding LacI/PurR family transcriptional regulator